MNTNFAQNLKELFTYKPEKNYKFTITENEAEQLPTKESNIHKIFNSSSVNQEYIKVKYNTLVNSDIIVRNFSLMAKGKEYKAFLLYIDGMINSTIINDFVLKPLMLRNKANTYTEEDDSTTIAVSRQYYYS